MPDVWRLLFGRRLATSEQSRHKMGVLSGVPALGLDGLSSAAYGPEVALAVLMPLGGVGLAYLGPIFVVIVGLLAVLYLSYRQTIAAYPEGGGSYTVARENLGVGASLLAAAALMIDYVLNVAVGISAGVGALISAFPSLQPYTVVLCLAILVFIMGMNLRGSSEAGLVFALPTYLFVACLGLVLAVGVVKTVLSGGHPIPVATLPPVPAPVAAVSVWLLLRAFASGCTAMTGVEAVSNGVSAFADPAIRRARQTLTVIVGILAVLLAGIAFLAQAYVLGAMDQAAPNYQSLLSQLTTAVLGNGVLYYVTIGSVLAVLALSANTSFVDFPRLCRLIAHDDFLPRPFTLLGRRLVYTVGIFFLTATAALLLIGFGGVTDRLIPLFAVGAFLAFTLSQLGMVVHWRKKGAEAGRAADARGRRKALVGLLINGAGALATGCALGVILFAKFLEGAWITVLAVPLLLLLFIGVKHYYETLALMSTAHHPLNLANNQPPVVVIPAEGWNKLTRRALRFGMCLSPDVIALHLSELEGESADRHCHALRQQWGREVERPAHEAKRPCPRLHVIHSRYRRFLEPVMSFVERLHEDHPDRQIAVVIPELVKTNWWHHLLHHRRGARLKSALTKWGNSRIAIITVPWRLQHLDDVGAVPT